MFPVVILGGLDSVSGAVVAGAVIGLLEAYTGGYVGHGLNLIVPFMVLLVVLMIRPYGLFGKEIKAPSRPDHVRAWDELTDDWKLFEEKRMTALAGMIDRIDQEQKAGRDAYNAVIEATVSRFRPIWMTTITTILGVMPLILSHDPVFYSLALIIATGLAFATVLTLGVVPVLYAVLFKVKQVQEA